MGITAACGNSQRDEFEKFNGPVLVTTNCIVPPKDSYMGRMFTTGLAGCPGVKHIAASADGHKDFSAVIAYAKTCQPPQELKAGSADLITGCAHGAVLALADKVVGAVKSGAIKKFIVMAGCDGRQKERDYYTQFALALPKDTVILTAGCAKYRYNSLDLGTIGGIPRVLDAGQCNDCYSLVVIAQALAKAFGVGINELAGLIQHRMVRAEGGARAPLAPVTGGQRHHARAQTAGVCLPHGA